MWLIEKRPFIEPENINEQKKIRKLFRADVADHDRPTFVIGNGLSQCAVYENKINNGSSDGAQIGWSETVKIAYKKIYNENVPPDANSLVVAESIIHRSRDQQEVKEARKKLLKEIKDGVRKLPPCKLHKKLIETNPYAYVTTNYDFLLEDAFKGLNKNWRCYVRDAWSSKKNSNTTKTEHIIYKMHGTLDPEDLADKEEHYEYPNAAMGNDPYTSIVISETDYDKCNEELARTIADGGGFWNALDHPLVILGKGVYWEDLSFMRMLRERKSRLKKEIPAYWLLNSLTTSERLTLHNLGIKPIILNMPRRREDATFYFALMRALEYLTESKITLDGDLAHEKRRLLRKPRFVAIGLSAYNTAGRVKFGSSNEPNFELPRAGRRNHEFTDAEEYAGGSALTAMGVYAALYGNNREHGGALISVVGDDIFSKQIFSFCDEWNIDSDAISSKTQKETWRSIVLIHDFKENPSNGHEGHKFPGQRIFLDRTFPDGSLEDRELQQFNQMINPTNSQLRVIYLDKWLADRPSGKDNNSPTGDHRATAGFLSDEQNRDQLKRITNSGDNVDIVYESGGSGSTDARVETAFAEYINVFTAGFPFFARRIIISVDQDKDKYENLNKFLQCEDPRTLDFQKEREAILDVLALLNINIRAKKQEWKNIPPDWKKEAESYIRKNHKNRWLVATLHDLGALALNLGEDSGIRYFPSHVAQKNVCNTAGAGDTFRGAFCFALTKCSYKNSRACLEICTAFAVHCASERCCYFSMTNALKNLKGLEVWSKLLRSRASNK